MGWISYVGGAVGRSAERAGLSAAERSAQQAAARASQMEIAQAQRQAMQAAERESAAAAERQAGRAAERHAAERGASREARHGARTAQDERRIMESSRVPKPLKYVAGAGAVGGAVYLFPGRPACTERIDSATPRWRTPSSAARHLFRMPPRVTDRSRQIIYLTY